MRQLRMFQQPSFNVVRDIKEALRRAVDQSGLSREQFLDELNDLAIRYGVRLSKGHGKLSKDTFDKWLNRDALVYLPSVAAIPLICQVSGNIEIIGTLIAPLGGAAIDHEKKKTLEWALAHRDAVKARKRVRELEAQL
jgi:transcriptional regulator with XRE-family HTH domain